MNQKRLQTAIACSVLSCCSLFSPLCADVEIAEFRHITKDGTDFTYYGCETACEFDFLIPPVVPASFTYDSGSPPNAQYELTNTRITNEPFAFGAQAGLVVNVDETSTTGTASWSSSEAHVFTEVEFADVAQVTGLNTGDTGTITFTWALDGEQLLTLDPTNDVGPADVRVIDVQTFAELSIDSAAMGVPATPPLFSTNPDPTNPNLPFPPSPLSTVYDQPTGETFGLLQFAGVPFTVGQPVVVEFDLAVGAFLGIENIDAPKFSATLDSIFQNTATLEAVEILDSAGNPIDGASLESLTGKGIYPSENEEPDPVQDIMIDITPYQESDNINNNLWGFIPVSILGSADFDVTQIDLATVEMDTLPVMFLPWINRHVAIQADTNGDSFTDYLVAIDDSDIVYERGDIIATLSGELLDGQEFEGSAAAVSLPNWFNQPPSAQAVPEPNGLGWLSILACGSMATIRRRSRR